MTGTTIRITIGCFIAFMEKNNLDARFACFNRPTPGKMSTPIMFTHHVALPNTAIEYTYRLRLS